MHWCIDCERLGVPEFKYVIWQLEEEYKEVHEEFGNKLSKSLSLKSPIMQNLVQLT